MTLSRASRRDRNAMTSTIKNLLRRSYHAHLVRYAIRNVGRSLGRYNRLATGGAYSSRAVDDAAQRGWKWARLFLEHCGLDPVWDGVDFVIEVGPGDSILIPLLWIGFGAVRAWGVDAFRDPRDLCREKRIVEYALRTAPEEMRRRILAVVDLGNDELIVDRDRVRYIERTPVERLCEAVGTGVADVVCSVSVLEHVWKLDEGLRSMCRVLKPGGIMCHHVDARNHGV